MIAEKEILLAPNGRPSNLSPEQYKIVRTPEFKSWFGDWEKLAFIKRYDSGIDDITLSEISKDVSKVVDENGEPLVVYHGTSALFNKFDDEEKGKRGGLREYFWSFTTNIKQALIYAQDKMYGSFSEPRIIHAFLNIKEMPVYNNEGRYYRELSVWGGYKFIDIFQLQDWHNRGFDMGVEFKKVDGFCVKNTIEMEDYHVENKSELIGDTYYVRNSNQIKLADGSNKTFDVSNPDIRFSEGGIIVGEEMGDFSFPTIEEGYEIIRDAHTSSGSVWIAENEDEEMDAMFDSVIKSQEYVKEVYGTLESLYDKEYIPVYRCVKADEVELDPYLIGESWSFSLSAAKEFGSHLGVKTSELKIISGYVPRQNVDWGKAFNLFHHFSHWGDSDAEFELPIPSNNKIIDVKVSSYKEAVELEDYKTN